MITHKLKINDHKTEFVILSSKHSPPLPNTTLCIGSSQIEPASNAINLGVYLDSTLCMEAHISSVSRSCLFPLRNISSIRNVLSDQATAKLIHSLVSSRMDYCNSLLYGLPDSALKPIQRVQNIAARILTRTSRFEHISPVLMSLHWLPIRQRILFKVLLLTFRLINEGPSYLSDLVTRYAPARQSRSSSQELLHIPKSRLKTVGDRSFFVAAPTE